MTPSPVIWKKLGGGKRKSPLGAVEPLVRLGEREPVSFLLFLQLFRTFETISKAIQKIGMIF